MRTTIPTGLLAIAALIPSALAVFTDEAYTVDYHHANLGLPSKETTFFHRPSAVEKASLLYTLSDLGVLGAVKPSTGELAWRQFLGANSNRTIGAKGTDGVETEGLLRPVEGENRVVSAVGGYVNAWEATTGKEAWYNQFEGRAVDLEIFGTETAVGGNAKDTLALFEHDGKGVVRRLDGKTGDVKWEVDGEKGDVPLQVSTDEKSVFVVALHGARGGNNVKVTSLHPSTGAMTSDNVLDSRADVHSKEDIIFVGANVAAPIIAWTDRDKKALHANVLGTKKVHTLNLATTPDEIVKVTIHAPHLVQSRAAFLVHIQGHTSHWAQVYHIDAKRASINLAYSLPKLSGHGAFSTSTVDADVYFTRVTDEEVIIVSSISADAVATYPLENNGAGQALHGVSEVVKKDTKYSVRTAVVTSEDNWTMITNGASTWTRVEGLSGAVAAAFAEIPEVESLAQALDVEAHGNPVAAYSHRLSRHINELQYLPAFLASVPQRIISAAIHPGDVTPVDAGTLGRDNFGFRKLVVVATERGRFYCLDTANNGAVVWSHRAFEIPAGQKWDVKGVFVDNHKGEVEVRGVKGEFIRVKVATGATVELLPPFEEADIQATAIVDSEAGKWLLPVHKGGEVKPVSNDWATEATIVVCGANGEVKGLKFTEHADQATTDVVWTFTPATGERIADITFRPSHDPVASIGRALADRSVLYKYLNPNILLITAINDAASSVSFYLLDSVSGAILYSTIHKDVDTTQPITSVVSENWFVYTFYSVATTSAQATGYQLVISELYESALPNDRGPLGSAANYSSLAPSEVPGAVTVPFVKSKCYVIPEPISKLAVTQTRQGITNKQILAALPRSHAIIGLPRNFVSAERQLREGGKPTTQDMEEGIIPYNSILDMDPRAVVSHEREVIGVRNIITAPALLESTTVVLAYGIDIFGTRVMPSMAFDVLGAGFNKVALVSTVVGLAAGVWAVAPLVRRKQIDNRWRS